MVRQLELVYMEGIGLQSVREEEGYPIEGGWVGFDRGAVHA